jgi:prepilin-type N-terminal cleavage/methylation domain-containing protein
MAHTHSQHTQDAPGFTLIEMVIVLAVLSILAAHLFDFMTAAVERAKTASALENCKRLETAILAYHSDMGFFPPDVTRGWDPGLAKRLPYNLDTGDDCAVSSADCPACTWCPSDWKAQVKAHWGGPYINSWTRTTPWGGKYDYNTWTAVTTRPGGCLVLPGIYLGVEGDYNNIHTISKQNEQWLTDKGLDKDGCINGESQILIGSSP